MLIIRYRNERMRKYVLIVLVELSKLFTI